MFSEGPQTQLLLYMVLFQVFTVNSVVIKNKTPSWLLTPVLLASHLHAVCSASEGMLWYTHQKLRGWNQHFVAVAGARPAIFSAYPATNALQKTYWLKLKRTSLMLQRLPLQYLHSRRHIHRGDPRVYVLIPPVHSTHQYFDILGLIIVLELDIQVHLNCWYFSRSIGFFFTHCI